MVIYMKSKRRRGHVADDLGLLCDRFLFCVPLTVYREWLEADAKRVKRKARRRRR